MTANHIFFIPSVFFLGLFVGFAIAESKRRRKSATEVRTKINGTSIATAFGIFAVVFALTHLLPVPGGVKDLHQSLGNQPPFDQKISFSIEDIYSRLSSFSEMGRASYMRFTFTTDVLFPLSLLFLLFTLSRFVRERTNLRRTHFRFLTLVPALWFVTDLIENSVIYSLLQSYPAKLDFLASILGPISGLKFAFLLASIVLPTITFIAFPKNEARDT